MKCSHGEDKNYTHGGLSGLLSKNEHLLILHLIVWEFSILPHKEMVFWAFRPFLKMSLGDSQPCSSTTIYRKKCFPPWAFGCLIAPSISAEVLEWWYSRPWSSTSIHRKDCCPRMSICQYCIWLFLILLHRSSCDALKM